MDKSLHSKNDQWIWFEVVFNFLETWNQTVSVWSKKFPKPRNKQTFVKIAHVQISVPSVTVSYPLTQSSWHINIAAFVLFQGLEPPMFHVIISASSESPLRCASIVPSSWPLFGHPAIYGWTNGILCNQLNQLSNSILMNFLHMSWSRKNPLPFEDLHLLLMHQPDSQRMAGWKAVKKHSLWRDATRYDKIQAKQIKMVLVLIFFPSASKYQHSGDRNTWESYCFHLYWLITRGFHNRQKQNHYNRG